MYYRLLVLGAIILGLSTLASAILLPKAPFPNKLQNQTFFRQAMARYDDSVYGWITGQRHHGVQRLLLRLFQHNKDLQGYAMSLFNGGSGNSNSDYILKSEDEDKQELAVIERESATDADVSYLPYCSDMIPYSETEVQHSDPPRYDPLPEGCEYFYGDIQYKKYLLCNSNEITSIPKLPRVLDVFEMNETQVQSIRDGAFEDTEIGVLRLTRNEISNIYRGAFRGLRKNSFLQIDYNRLTNVWLDSAFYGLNETNIIYLEHNSISYENVGTTCREKEVKEIRTVLPNLVHLTLKGNPLKKIAKTTFAGLRQTTAFTFLILENCQLQEIHPEAFSFLTSMKHLNLAENPHLMVNLGTAFSGLAPGTLTHLDLSRNSLISLPKDAFAMIASSLKEVDLRGNSFQTMGQDFFPSNMTEITQINLGECMLSSIHEAVFDHLVKLESVVLKGNRLKTFPAALSNLAKLSILDLSFQHEESTHIPFLFEIPPNSMASLMNLRMLFLSGTRIVQLRNDMFVGALKLNMLIMEDCGLTTIEDNTFDGLKSLRVLGLVKNPLKVIRADMFYGLGALTTLYMDNVEFSLPSKMPGYETVRYIDSTNPMEPSIDFVTMGQVLNYAVSDPSNVADLSIRPFHYLNRLEYLYLSGNQLTDLYPETFENMTSLHLLDLNNNRIASWDTPLFANNPKLEELYLKNNQILTVTSAMFDDFENVNTNIDLTYNPFLCDFGTCRLKNETESKAFRLQEWYGQPDLYTCIMTQSPRSENVLICTLSQEFCEAQEPINENPTDSEPTDATTPTMETTEKTTTEGEVEEPPATTTESDVVKQYVEKPNNKLVTIISLAITGASFVALAIFMYVKRLHLRYFWFVVRLNFKKIPLRKARTSELIEKDSYDFDVFISYSHYDSEFIQDRLVPELEGSGKYIDKSQEEDSTSQSEKLDFGYTNAAIFDKNQEFDAGFTNPNFFAMDPESGFTNNAAILAKNAEADATNYTKIDMDTLSMTSGSSGSSTASNLKVCLHERDFEVGTPITENIIECVDKSRKIIVVVSKKYLESQWCLFEMNLAYHRLVEARRRSFVVILLEDIPMGSRTKVLNYLMRSRTYLEWPRSGPDSQALAQAQKVFWKRLKRSLASEE